MFERIVFRKTFKAEREEVTADWKKCVINSFMGYILSRILLGKQNERICNVRKMCNFCNDPTALVSLGILIFEVARSYSDTPRLVGPLLDK
jgi:hypothetical protein